MDNPKPPPAKIPSLADYLVRYDLATMLEEARLDYNQSTSGGPRHLAQKDIAARFRARHPSPDAPAASHEPS
jgi:hypothetical protein